jgi:DNA topoisomerase-1
VGKAAIIVESPTKTKTLKRFLGDQYELLASMGHVRDLPENEIAVDIDHGFAPSYTTTPRQKKLLSSMKQALKSADRVYLASDPDREGEAIAWHLAEALGLKDAERIEFNEITESAVREALEHPRAIDMDRVNAQQARRVLDRLVGYMLSPLLWEKVTARSSKVSLSAGRVQSAALKLICDREREVAAFIPEEYWTILVKLFPHDRDVEFEAELKTRDGEDLELKCADEALPIAEELQQLAYSVRGIERKERRRNPQPPFITSTLQRAAANALNFPARKTMSVAQQLYQGIDTPDGSLGLITYMRTDSTRVAAQAREAAVAYIEGQFGKQFVGPGATGKKVAGAQDAHEAIRPSYVERTPESLRPFLDDDQFKLYDLIWRRFVASQMAAAVFDITTVDIVAGRYGLRAVGSVLKFAGFREVLPSGDDDEEKSLPALTEGEELRLVAVSPDQHFTKPPPRFNEATLVRALEENGVGRPSTYAQIIETLRQRKYVRMETRQFIPTGLGFSVNDYLAEGFEDIINIDFTAKVEAELDGVEEGEMDWVELLTRFYGPFKERLDLAQQAPPRELEEPCPECGGKLIERFSQHGKFAGCVNYPDCKYTRDLLSDVLKRPQTRPLDEKCPECGEGLVVRQSRGQDFVGCSAYPKCKYTRPMEGDSRPVAKALETDIPCEACGKPMLVRIGRRGAFLGCSGYPKCRSTRNLTEEERLKWAPDSEPAPEGSQRIRRPRREPVETDIVCEDCGKKKMLVRWGRRGPFLGCSGYPRCRGTRNLTDEERAKWAPDSEAADGDASPAPARKQAIETDIVCEDCGKKKMLIRWGRRGPFLGCSGYPKCRGTRNLTDEERARWLPESGEGSGD